MNKTAVLTALVVTSILLPSCNKVTNNNVNTAPATSEKPAAAAPTPQEASETRQPAEDSSAQSSKNTSGYFVIGLSSRQESEATQEAERRRKAGYQTQVVHSSEWSDLSPGWYIVVYDVFGSMAEATAKAREFQSRGINVYAKYSGTAKSGGTVILPDKELSRNNEETSRQINPSREAAIKQVGTDADEALGEVEKVWNQHFTKCGDSYVAVGSNNILRQLKDVSFAVSKRDQLTEGDKSSGFEWSGTIKARWNAWRRATRQASSWVWGEWRDSPQEHSFTVTKKNSKWRVLDVTYDQKKVECSGVNL